MLPANTYTRAFEKDAPVNNHRITVVRQRRGRTAGARSLFGRSRDIVYSGTKFDARKQSNRAWARACQQFGKLTNVDQRSKLRLWAILHDVLEDHMASVTLSQAQDSGVIAEWRAGLSYIALEISPEFTSFVYTDEHGNMQVNESDKQAVNPEQIRESLEKFSRVLESKNLNWRNIFS